MLAPLEPIILSYWVFQFFRRTTTIPNPNEQIVNLEHILPEKPSGDWSHVNAELAQGYWRRLGNMVLLKSRVNSKIGNKGFHEKKLVFQDSEIQLTKSVSKYDVWDIQQIEERQQALAELAVKLWSLKPN